MTNSGLPYTKIRTMVSYRENIYLVTIWTSTVGRARVTLYDPQHKLSVSEKILVKQRAVDQISAIIGDINVA